MAGNKVRIVAEADDKASGTFDKLRDKIDGFKSQGATGFGLGIGASIGAKAFGVLDGAIDKAVETVFDSIHAASDLRESMTLTEQVFGKNTKAVVEWAGARDDAFSKTEALNYLSQFGNLLQGAGVALDEASDKAEKLTTLAGDLGSAFNTSSAEAADAIKSGLIGESEPLRRFGVILSEAAVQAEAVSMGISKSGKNLTDSEKALARYSLIMKGTVRVQGTFGKDTASLADAQKLLETNVTDLEATLATQLIPTLADWTRSLADVAAQATETGGPVDQLGQLLADLGNSFDPQPAYEAQTAIGDLDRTATDALNNFIDLLTFWDSKNPGKSTGVGEWANVTDDAAGSADSFVSSSREMGRSLHLVDDRAADAGRTIATLGRKTGTTADDFKDLNKWAQEAGDTLAEAAYGPEELRLKFEGARAELRHDQVALSNVTDKIDELKRKGKPVPTELQGKFRDLRLSVNEGKQEVIRLGTKLEATGAISMADLRKEFDKAHVKLSGLTGEASDLWWYLNHISDVDLGTLYDNNKKHRGGKGQAKGGPVNANEMYIVGEKGPELFMSSTAGTIIPNDKLQGGGWGMPSSGGGSPVTLHINVSTPVLTPGAAEQLAQSIGPVLTRWQQSRGLIAR